MSDVNAVGSMSEPARKTYLYLRVGVVGMALLLAISLAIEIARGEGVDILGSISAYYYTPVRGVFVGALMAVGLGLVAIKGREGAEDVLLNLAGMLAPMVALVPTPISYTVAGYDVPRRSVPTELVPAVENNVKAMLVLGVVAVVFAVATAARNDTAHRQAALRGAGFSALVVAAFGLWFAFGRGTFLEYGHYAAAIPMFACIVVVAWINAVQAGRPVAGVTALTNRRAYGFVAFTMGLAVVVGVVFFILDQQGSRPFPAWLFWVEAALLALFAVFWLLQTVENAGRGLPEEAAARPTAAQLATPGSAPASAPAGTDT
ncbi:MAG: hypothetical protein ACRDOM_09225 [Nocardioides sp.]